MSEHVARVRLVRTQAGQRLDIPPGFVLSGDEAILYAEGGRLVVEPVSGSSLLAVLDDLEDIDEDWPEIADPHPDEIRL